MDKITLQFITDVLYLKGILCIDELEDIQQAKNFEDLDNIFEKMYRGDYNVYKRGEHYTKQSREQQWGIDDATGEDTTLRASVSNRAIYLEQISPTT